MAQRPIYQENIHRIRRRVSVFYLAHPRARVAVRLGTVLAVVLALSWYLDSAGYLTSGTLSRAYFAAVAGLAVVVAVLSLLGIRGRFTGLIPESDPGHLQLPYLPEGLDAEDASGLIKIPPDLIPGTYPKGSAGDSSRRGYFQWAHPPGQHDSLRALQVKFGTIAIHARGRDAKEARAHARVRVNHGTLGSVPLGTWFPIGRLNWYAESWDDRLMFDERIHSGKPTCHILDEIYETPGLGLNSYLRNPEVTIHRDQSQALPLFYMREDWPGVYLCGQHQAVFIGKSPDEAPVDFDMELEVSALDFRQLKLKLHCTAEWDVLVVEVGQWKP